MFKVIESLRDKPTNFLFKDSLYFPEPGLIISIKDGTAAVSDGASPFGVIGDYPNEFNLIPVWFDSMIFETNMIEPDNFKIKDFLYCSRLGKFTNKKISEDSLLLGFVSEVKENSLIIELI